MFSFNDLNVHDDAVKELKSKLAKAVKQDIPLVQIGKAKRVLGVSVKPLTFGLSNGQVVTCMIRQSGDIYRVTLNDKDLPLKSDASSIDAYVSEIADYVKDGQKSFSGRMLNVLKRLTVPNKVQTTRQKLDDLQSQEGDLDQALEQATAHRDGLKSKVNQVQNTTA